MIDINELRRLAKSATPGPWQFWHGWVVTNINSDGGTVIAERPIPSGRKYQARIDGNFRFIAAANPAVINEILDRLEAAEKEVEMLRQGIAFRDDVVAALAVERDALRARIEAMERRGPVAWRTFDGEGGYDYRSYADNENYQLGWNARNPNHAGWVEPLYLAPGAQRAPIEQDTSVRKAWARFSNELHRSHDAPYPGMSEAFEQHFSQSFTDREWRAESGTWAAAWKAAKRHDAQPTPSVPHGWKLVPIEPTPSMKTAGLGVEVYQDSPPSTDCLTWEEVRALYKAMLAAAPEAKP